MPAVQRLTDQNDAGGAIDTIPQGSVFVNGLLVSVDGSLGTSHPPCPVPDIHCAGNWSTSGGSGDVFINGIPVNRTGDPDTCGHVRVGGSPDTFVN